MSPAAGASPISGLDTSRPNAARMYDYMLGGKDNFAADRDAADRLRAVAPELSHTAWANRKFHQRATAWMAEAGITQFIDIGCGLPTMENTHQGVQRIMAGARVAYVDYDPVVIVHAKALLVKGDDNAAAILGDLRNPAGILDALRDSGLLDLGKPCGVLITAVLHFIPAAHDPVGAVRRLTGALARGSRLALSPAPLDGGAAGGGRVGAGGFPFGERPDDPPQQGGGPQLLRRHGPFAAMAGRRARRVPGQPVGQGQTAGPARSGL